jgi:hypothetical protein
LPGEEGAKANQDKILFVMKNSIFLLLCTCSCLIFLTLGCDETQLQTPSLSETAKIDLRVDDCEDCPNMDDCCCVLTITSGAPKNYKLCGTTDGDATTCEVDPAPGSCSTIDGLQHSFFTLTNMEPTELFCMAPNTSFELRQLSAGMATLTLTCQVGETNPQTVNITFTGQDRRYFEVNGDCEVSDCE